jgi:hypothetical protein
VQIWVTWLEARAQAISSVLRLAIPPIFGMRWLLAGFRISSGAPGITITFSTEIGQLVPFDIVIPKTSGDDGIPSFPSTFFQECK